MAETGDTGGGQGGGVGVNVAGYRDGVFRIDPNWSAGSSAERLM